MTGVDVQLGTCDGPSVNCLITGLTAGASAGANDLDGGLTTFLSPLIALPSSGTLTLTFRFYFSHLNNSSSADLFRLRVVGPTGATTVVFQELGSAANDAAAWVTRTVNLSSFAGQSIRLLFAATDAKGASLVEAGVDNVLITRQ